MSVIGRLKMSLVFGALAFGLTVAPIDSFAQEQQELPKTNESPAARSAPLPRTKKSFDYAQMFELTRRALIKRPEFKRFIEGLFEEALTLSPEFQKEYDFKKGKVGLTESFFMMMLQSFPDVWGMLDSYLDKVEVVDPTNESQKAVRAKFRADFKTLFESKNMLHEFMRLSNPTSPIDLKTFNGRPGITSREIFFTHDVTTPYGVIAASNLIQKWVEFIDGASEKLLMNTFEFDVPEITDALIRAKKRGVELSFGVDKNMFDREGARPSMVEQVKRLQAAGVDVVLVDSVGLNHQKMGVRDWHKGKIAKVIQSSGNLTDSCIAPHGDLEHVQGVKPEDLALGRPNANHMVIMTGEIPALVVHHDLTKTLSLKLKGAEYPTVGAFRIFAPNDSYVVMSFSPHGGNGEVNRDIFARVISISKDPIYVMSFAFSSDDLENALFDEASQRTKEGRKFEFHGVGDRPFAMADWSAFLSMSGLMVNPELATNPNAKKFIIQPNNRWKKVMGERGLQKLRANILVGPRIYSETEITLVDGTSFKVSAKIHHKLLVTGDFSTAGTSFNQSAGANSNQEQVSLWKDKQMADMVRWACQTISSLSTATVYETAQRINEFKQRADEKKANESTTEERSSAIRTATETAPPPAAKGDCNADVKNL